MARRYSGKKGQSGSKKPAQKSVPSWVRYSAKEVEMLIVKMAKEGMSTSTIGMALRDKYGIPDVQTLCGSSITKIVEKNKLTPELPDDMTALLRRAASIRRHMEENRQDMTAKRGLQLTESKIQRLVKYYKTLGRLPADWKYDPTRAAYFLE